MFDPELSEVNAFLERRNEEQSASAQERDRITEHIQKDLSGRLQQSRQELSSIRLQMKGKAHFILQTIYGLHPISTYTMFHCTQSETIFRLCVISLASVPLQSDQCQKT